MINPDRLRAPSIPKIAGTPEISPVSVLVMISSLPQRPFAAEKLISQSNGISFSAANVEVGLARKCLSSAELNEYALKWHHSEFSREKRTWFARLIPTRTKWPGEQLTSGHEQQRNENRGNDDKPRSLKSTQHPEDRRDARNLARICPGHDFLPPPKALRGLTPSDLSLAAAAVAAATRREHPDPSITQ